jgi:hypothetical protein
MPSTPVIRTIDAPVAEYVDNELKLYIEARAHKLLPRVMNPRFCGGPGRRSREPGRGQDVMRELSHGRAPDAADLGLAWRRTHEHIHDEAVAGFTGCSRH